VVREKKIEAFDALFPKVEKLVPENEGFAIQV
jgi:hypothetical protein